MVYGPSFTVHLVLKEDTWAWLLFKWSVMPRALLGWLQEYRLKLEFSLAAQLPIKWVTVSGSLYY